MSETTRTMTIARGLTRLKTIKAQLVRLQGDLREYAFWNDKQKCPLIKTEESVAKNHAGCRSHYQSLVQQFNDLIKEYKTIKRAIDLTNLKTSVEIAGQVLSLNEAMMYKQYLGELFCDVSGSMKRAEADSRGQVERYNLAMAKNIEDPQIRNNVMANVINFVPAEFLYDVYSTSNEFLAELDGTLNEVNALTPLVWDIPTPNP